MFRTGIKYPCNVNTLLFRATLKGENDLVRLVVYEIVEYLLYGFTRGFK